VSKAKTIYACQACGYQTPKWLGKCPECGGWSTIVEEIISPLESAHSSIGIPMVQSSPQPLSEIKLQAEERVLTHIGEFDRVKRCSTSQEKSLPARPK